MSFVERLTGVDARRQGPMFLVGIGHGGTHWVGATFYLLLPFLAPELGLGYAEIGLLAAVYHASSFAANFVSGLVVDITGRRALFQVLSLAIGGLALGGFGGGGHVLWLMLLVALIGAASNLWHPAAISYISQNFPKNRGYALSIHALGANAGDALAPIVAGLLLTWLTWQSTAMVTAVPVLLLALLLAVLLMPRERRDADAPRHGMAWRAYWAGLACVVRNRAVLGLCLMAAFRTMTQSGLRAFLPLYLANVIGLGPLWLGLALSALQLGGIVATPLAGVWSDRKGRRPVVLAGLTAATVIIVALTFVGGMLFIAGTALLGFALYAIRPVVHGWMMDLTPPSLGGSATSLMFGSQALLAVLAPAVGGAIAEAWGLQAVFYFLAASMLAANFLVYLLPDGNATATELPASAD